VFQVRPMKHTGLLLVWYNQRSAVTGTYAQCLAAINAAQRYNRVVGWWSVASLFLWNWIALGANRSERKRLGQQAAYLHTRGLYRMPNQPPTPWHGQ
jgi:hypothetical protein